MKQMDILNKFWKPAQVSRTIRATTAADGSGYFHKTGYAPNGVANYEVSYNPKTGHVIQKARTVKGDGAGGSFSSKFIGANPGVPMETISEHWI